MNERQLVIEEVSDAAEISRARAQLERGKRNSDWLASHWGELLPTPRRGCKLPTHRFVFEFDEATLKQDEAYDGYSVLVTTTPPERDGVDSLFKKFKELRKMGLNERPYAGAAVQYE